MDTRVYHHFPETLVLPTADLLEVFFQEVGGKDVVGEDTGEILTQIIQVLLNDDEFSEKHLRVLPDMNRLINGNRIENARLQQAVYNLGCAIRQRLIDYGAYTLEGFPYFLDRMVGHDLVLHHLPH